MDAKTRKRIDLVKQGLETAQMVLLKIADEQLEKSEDAIIEALADQLSEDSDTLTDIAERIEEIIEELEAL